MERSVKHEESLTVHLETQDTHVDAAAVAATMKAVVTIINETHKQLAANEQLLIKARPFAAGSFEIPLDLIAISTAALFATSPLLDSLFDILEKFFKVKKALKGDAAEHSENNTVSIEGENESVGSIVINLLRPSSPSTKDFADAMSANMADESIRGLRIYRTSQEEPLASVERSEFPYFAATHGQTRDGEQREVRTRELLTICSPVLLGKARKWSFYLQGRVIAAAMEHDEFVERVRKGENFSAGDRLDVELVAHQKFDATIGDYKTTNYSIAFVWEHIKRQDVPKLFDSEQ